jgi:hypothetical protein
MALEVTEIKIRDKVTIAGTEITSVETTLTGGNSALPRADAVKAYVDNLLNANDAMQFKGTIGTGGTVTALPTTHSAGWTFRVITAATYAGVVTEVGDLIIAVIDRAGTGNANSDWTVVQTNIDGAVVGPASAVSANVARFNGTSGKLIQDSGISFETTLTTGSDAKSPTSKAVATYVTGLGYTTNTGTVTGVTGTAPIASSGGTAPVISITAATTSAAGSMSSADKTKLDGIAAGATANTGTVISVSAGTQISGMAMTITNGTTTPSIATSVSNAANFRTAIGAGTGNGTVTAVTGTAPIVSSGGTAPAISISAATTSAAGSMSSADKTKLDGIAAGATANTGTVTGVTGTAPIVSSGGTAPAISISAATTSVAGSMSSADKTKLDGIAAGAQVNVATNLSYTDSTRVIASSTGTNATLPVVVAAGISGLMTGADKTKLDGIAAGAQVNVATNLAQGTRTTTAVPVTSSTGTSATLDIATTSLAGVMSSADKTKLDGIATGAQVNVGTNLGIIGGTTAGPTVTSTTGTNATIPSAGVSNSGVITTGAQSISGVKTLENSFTGASGTSTFINSQVIAGALPSASLVAVGLRVTATGNSVDFHAATGIVAKAVGGSSNDAIVAYGIDGVLIAPSDTSLGKSLRLKGVTGTSATTILQTNSATSSAITVTLPSTGGTLTLNGHTHTYADLTGTVPTWNQSTTGNAANVTGIVAVANGGTGQNTLALARNAMGLGNTTGAVPIANGGTGAASVNAGGVVFGNTGGASYTSTATPSALTQYLGVTGGANNQPLWRSPADSSVLAVLSNSSTGLATERDIYWGTRYIHLGVTTVAGANTNRTISFTTGMRNFILQLHQDSTTGAIIARLPLTISNLAGNSTVTDVFSLDTTARTHRVAWSNGAGAQIMNVSISYSGTTITVSQSFNFNCAFRLFGF